ncbi:hypothetical protein WN944_024573 [Citrus x changshan-huyou]|uniref:Uncharacterized protein n=1 Tax=Citrus x changshan-huyou TaxID=2935761 RepID=A0AAP0LRL7_9ROSI
MVVAQKGNQNWKGNEKIQDYANHQNGNLNRGSKFGVLLVDDDGGNNQNEGNEFLIAILSNKTTTLPKHQYQSHNPIRKPSDVGMLTINEDMEEDIDDSDYLGTSDEEGSGTSEDDTSLVNEEDMEVELEV